MRYQPVIQAGSIVVVGELNPAIFSPGWLCAHSLISEAEMDAADVSVIHAEVTRFEIGELQIDAAPQRFLIQTLEEPFIRIADMVAIIFGKLLPHSPVKALGINYDIHFLLDSLDQRTSLGRAVAPLGPWGEFGRSIGDGDPNSAGGVRTIIMEESHPSDREIGFRRVKMEPSFRDELSKGPGVYLQVNDHFGLEGDEPRGDAVPALLKKHFDGSISRSKAIVAELMEFSAGLER